MNGSLLPGGLVPAKHALLPRELDPQSAEPPRERILDRDEGSSRPACGPARRTIAERSRAPAARGRTPTEWNVPIRVILADDHALVRQGLRALLEGDGFEVAGEAADGQEALRLVSAVRPDVAIFDIGMPLLNGLEAARALQKSSQRTNIILLTRHDEPQYVTEALRAGVKGYVLKSQAAMDLAEAIERVARSGVYLSPEVSTAVVDAFLSKTESAPDPLSSRERQVLQMVGEGKSTKEVATLLGISAKTAESHRARLMRKLDIHETASLVRYAIRSGLLEP